MRKDFANMCAHHKAKKSFMYTKTQHDMMHVPQVSQFLSCGSHIHVALTKPVQKPETKFNDSNQSCVLFDDHIYFFDDHNSGM